LYSFFIRLHSWVAVCFLLTLGLRRFFAPLSHLVMLYVHPHNRSIRAIAFFLFLFFVDRLEDFKGEDKVTLLYMPLGI